MAIKKAKAKDKQIGNWLQISEREKKNYKSSHTTLQLLLFFPVNFTIISMLSIHLYILEFHWKILLPFRNFLLLISLKMCNCLISKIIIQV